MQKCCIIKATKEVIGVHNHKKKFIAPIVVTIILLLYYAFYFGLLIDLFNGELGAWEIAFFVIPAILAAVSIKVCVERIKEIKKGEEDDSSKY